MKTNEKVSWMTIFGVVSVWFGAHAGGGFASGNQTMNFFVQYGWPAIFTPIISMVVLAIIYRIIVIMCNEHGCTNYNDWSHQLYAPYDKVLSPIYEVCNLGAGLLATSASIAGGAAVIQESFGLPYMMCVLIVSVVTILISLFGAGVISKVSSLLVVLIMISVLAISICGLAANGGHIFQDIAANYAPMGVGAAVWKSMTYSSFQIFSLLGTFGVATQLVTQKNCNKATIMGFIMNASMLLLNTLLCLAYREDVMGNTLPILTIAKSLHIPALTILYSVCLFSAFISTAGSVVFGTIMRFSKFNVKFKMNSTVWNLIVGIIIIAGSMFAASFGLTAIVAVGYGYLGIIGIFLVAIPAIIVGTRKISKFRKEHPDAEVNQ